MLFEFKDVEGKSFVSEVDFSEIGQLSQKGDGAKIAFNQHPHARARQNLRVSDSYQAVYEAIEYALDALPNRIIRVSEFEPKETPTVPETPKRVTVDREALEEVVFQLAMVEDCPPGKSYKRCPADDCGACWREYLTKEATHV